MAFSIRGCNPTRGQIVDVGNMSEHGTVNLAEVSSEVSDGDNALQSKKVVDSKSIVEGIVADKRIEILEGANNSITFRVLGEISNTEYAALDQYFNVDSPLMMEANSKKKRKPSESGFGLELDEPHKKLNYCTDFIDYTKKGNPRNIVSMFFKSDPMFKPIMADYAQRVAKSTKFLLPSDGRIIDVNLKKGSLKEQYQPYIQHFKLPYESIAFEINYCPDEKAIGDLPVSNIPMILLCEEIQGGIAVSVFYRDLDRFWIVVNESPIILRDDFSRPMAAMKNYDASSDVGSNLKETFGSFVEFASRLTYDFLCAVNCSNIDVSDEIKAAKFANQKRVNKGKAPLFDYRVLVLDFNIQNNGNSDYSEVNHSRKRAHLRRGHIRRLKHKTIWVNACAVGGRNSGKLEKDYAIRESVKI